MPECLQAAAKRRSEDSRNRVLAALELMRKTRKPINVSSVAKAAGVSKNYIYTTPELRELVIGERDADATKVSAPSKSELVSLLKRENKRLLSEIEILTSDDLYSDTWKARYEEERKAREQLEADLLKARHEVRELKRQLRAAYDYSAL